MKDEIRLLDMKCLNSFYQVARTKSFSVAAEELFLTQPAVSQHVKKLEQRLGSCLIEREGQVNLTPAGMLVYRYAEKHQFLYRELISQLTDMDATGPLRVALSATLCERFTAELLAGLQIMSSRPFSVELFSAGREVCTAEYDMILGLDYAPESGGHLSKVSDSRYKIIVFPDSFIDTERVVYCSSLTLESVKQLLKEQEITFAREPLWLSASSSGQFSSVLSEGKRVLICPDWSCTQRGMEKQATRLCSVSFAWCNESFACYLSEQVGSGHLTDFLTDAVKSDIRFEQIN